MHQVQLLSLNQQLHILFLNRDGTLARDTEVINDFTTNGPVLAKADAFGMGVANIGDLDGNGKNVLHPRAAVRAAREGSPAEQNSNSRTTWGRELP